MPLNHNHLFVHCVLNDLFFEWKEMVEGIPLCPFMCKFRDELLFYKENSISFWRIQNHGLAWSSNVSLKATTHVISMIGELVWSTLWLYPHTLQSFGPSCMFVRTFYHSLGLKGWVLVFPLSIRDTSMCITWRAIPMSWWNRMSLVI